MRKPMSKTMREDEAAAMRASLKGKPSPVPPAYQRFIEDNQGQQRLPCFDRCMKCGKWACEHSYNVREYGQEDTPKGLTSI